MEHVFRDAGMNTVYRVYGISYIVPRTQEASKEDPLHSADVNVGQNGFHVSMLVLRRVASCLTRQLHMCTLGLNAKLFQFETWTVFHAVVFFGGLENHQRVFDTLYSIPQFHKESGAKMSVII